VGNPALAMHSARELGGAADPAMLIAALQAFLSPA
jgi:aspartyl aminopeptidase